MSVPREKYRLRSSRRIGELFERGVRAGDVRGVLIGLPNV